MKRAERKAAQRKQQTTLLNSTGQDSSEAGEAQSRLPELSEGGSGEGMEGIGGEEGMEGPEHPELPQSPKHEATAAYSAGQSVEGQLGGACALRRLSVEQLFSPRAAIRGVEQLLLSPAQPVCQQEVASASSTAAAAAAGITGPVGAANASDKQHAQRSQRAQRSRAAQTSAPAAAAMAALAAISGTDAAASAATTDASIAVPSAALLKASTASGGAGLHAVFNMPALKLAPPAAGNAEQEQQFGNKLQQFKPVAALAVGASSSPGGAYQACMQVGCRLFHKHAVVGWHRHGGRHRHRHHPTTGRLSMNSCVVMILGEKFDG